MAKRFIDTTLFRKEFIRGLEAPYKLLWVYIINECDHAGLWDVEMDVAQARLGLPELSEKYAIQFFGDKIHVVNGGSKWFIPDFIDFQYGNLNPQNRVHQSVIQILEKYKIKPLTSPLQGAKDKDKDKDKDKEKDKEQIEISELEKTFDAFYEMRRRIKKPATPIAQVLILKELKKLAGDNEQLTIEILNQSIRNCWQDVYPLKKNAANSTDKTPLTEFKQEDANYGF
jgi:hypothetical protein